MRRASRCDWVRGSDRTRSDYTLFTLKRDNKLDEDVARLSVSK